MKNDRHNNSSVHCFHSIRHNPSDRSVGSSTEQRLEVNTQGTSNCLTSVQKDNLVIEPQYRIRKLTPRECGKLMGVSDEDISKMAAVNSNTQLYKQFGNSIVVDVMCAMFKNLNIKQGDGRADEQQNYKRYRANWKAMCIRG